MHKFIGQACVFILGATLAACGGPKTQEQGTSPATSPADAVAANQSVAANGEAAYATAVAAPSANTVAAPPAFAQCQACHSAEPGQNGVGPSLAGIFGTKAADVAGYHFSAAMQKSGLTWDEATLDRYLQAPQKVVPGTKMTFPGLKDDTKRAAVIAYLQAIK